MPLHQTNDTDMLGPLKKKQKTSRFIDLYECHKIFMFKVIFEDYTTSCALN
ncbi:hypothetical protein Hanom_Chr00s106869g01806131 [Helianthus anomalus]